MTLLTFRKDAKDDDVKDYCKSIHSFATNSRRPSLARIAISFLSGKNIRIPTFDSEEMRSALDRVLSETAFDLVVATGSVAFYVSNLRIPKIVYAQDATAAILQTTYRNAKGVIDRIGGWAKYVVLRKYEAVTYPHFDRCIVLTPLDAKMLSEYSPRSDIDVIPLGLDTEYFSPIDVDEEDSIVYVGDMSSPQNIQPVMEFTGNIYPTIKKSVPSVKFYVVGRNPPQEIIDLASDPSIIVTGEVPDTRPYVGKSAVVVAPNVYELGIKNKVMIGMSMAKPVVTTKTGTNALDIRDEEHLLVAENDEDFANKVIYLLQNPSVRSTIGNSAREYMVNNNSTIKSSQMFESLVTEVLENHSLLNAKKIKV